MSLLFRPHIFLLALAGLSACYRSERNLAENTAYVHMAFNPKGFHPTNDMDAGRAYVFDYTQRALLKIDLRTNHHIPLLIEKIPEPDSTGTIYNMRLREGITWDDGTLLSVNDIIFSVKLAVHPLTANPGLKGIFRSVIRNLAASGSDPYSFYMQAQQPHNGNLEIFTELYIQQEKFWDPAGILHDVSFASIMSPDYVPSDAEKRWFEKFNSRDNAFQPARMNGLGPYKVTDWLEDSHITLVRKKDWWGNDDTCLLNQNNPDKIIFKIIKEDAALCLSLKNDIIDATNKVSTTKMLKLKKQQYFNANFNYKMVDQFAYGYIGLNMKPDGSSHLPIFTDRRVRRAMAHLVPVDDLIKVFSKGYADRQVSHISRLKREYNHSLKPIEFSVEKAMALLREAGWKDSDKDHIRDKVINGQKIRLSFKLNYITEQPGGKETVLLIRDCMYRAGVEVIPNPMDLGHFYESAYRQDFDAMMGSWLSSAGYDDPAQIWHTEAWKSYGNNFCGYGNRYSDSLINVVNTAMDEKTYLEACYALQEDIYNEQPYIFLYSPKSKVVIHKRFTNAGMYAEKPNMYVNAFTLLPLFGSRNTPSLPE